jgi:hypothetical protein
VNFEDLPPERQAELRQAMAEAAEVSAARAAAPRTQAESQVPSTLSPGVREAAITARAAEIAKQTTQAPPEAAGEPEVVLKSSGPDFRRNPEPPPEAAPTPVYNDPPPASVDDVVAAMPERLKPPPGAQVAGMSGIAPFVTGQIPKPPQGGQAAPAPPPPETDPEPQPETDPLPEEGAGGELPITRCPRCLWNMSHSFEANPTEEDRVAFVATILGTDRFRKQYSLLGGKFRVMFRSLTSDETDLVFRQMRLDQLRMEILGDADYFGRLNVYRLACMVEKISQGDGTIIADVPPIMDIPYDSPEFGQPEQTRLIPMVEWFNSEVCKTESLRRIVAQKHREFQRILEALEAQTSDPSFWTEIG